MASQQCRLVPGLVQRAQGAQLTKPKMTPTKQVWSSKLGVLSSGQGYATRASVHIAALNRNTATHQDTHSTAPSQYNQKTLLLVMMAACVPSSWGNEVSAVGKPKAQCLPFPL